MDRIETRACPSFAFNMPKSGKPDLGVKPDDGRSSDNVRAALPSRRLEFLVRPSGGVGNLDHDVSVIGRRMAVVAALRQLGVGLGKLVRLTRLDRKIENRP